MVEINNTLRLVRTAVFATTSLFALVVIILGGLVTNFSDSFLGGFFNFAALGIATGLLTLLTLPAMLALSMVRKGAFTSMIALEIGWTWFLWIMWLAVGGNSADGLAFVGSCDRFVGFGAKLVATCNESKAISALGFLSWIMLLFYCAFLSTLTFRQHLRGNTGIWTKDVTDTDFTAVGANNNPPIVYDNKAVYPNQYPPGGSPVLSQQTSGYPAFSQQTSGIPYLVHSDSGIPYLAQQTSGNVSYPTGSPYQSPQPTGLYNQPPGATGSFTHPHAQTGPNPHPQV